MAVDPKIFAQVDKRFPATLTGDADKVVVVNATETAYVHSDSQIVQALVGHIIMWPLDAAPDGYLICDGASYAYDTYPTLGELLGGSAGGNFNVPDLTDRFPKGSGGTGTNTQEAEDIGVHSHIANAVPSHSHSLSINSVGNHQHIYRVYTGEGLDGGACTRRNDCAGSYIDLGTNGGGAHGHTGSAANNGGHTPVVQNSTGTVNQPACTLINFCIKT